MSETQIPKQKSKKKLWIILGITGTVSACLVIGLFIVGVYFSNQYSSSGSGYSYNSLESNSSLSRTGTTMPMDLEEKSISSEAMPANTAAGSSLDNSEDELTEQKVIKTGNISLQVEKAGNTVTSLTNLAKARDGFILSSSLYTSSDETQSGTVILKVPVTRYEETINEIKKLGDTQSESSTGQDVTEQYSDLQAQLKNYKAEEEQYLTILEKADTVEDILKVTEKLSVVRGYIETTQGRIKYLEGQTDMSTITVSLSEETRIDIPTKEWKPYETLKQAFRTWIIFLQGLINVGIWVIIFLGPVIVAVYIIVKLIIRRIKKKKESRS